MSFEVTTRQQSTSGLDGTLVVLSNPHTGERAEVWPALGFNCVSWRGRCGGEVVDVLYADPQLFENGRPTRSGFPILFPFPNRIRDGRFSWDSKDYQLPLNDGSGKNAIHGFACRRPWRVVGRGIEDSGAWVTGEFQCSRDDPDSRGLWPSDHILRVTYRLRESRLLIEAEVRNPDRVSLPFGLGYHPYFRVPLGAGSPTETLVRVPARKFWELQENLPTGRLRSVDPSRDLREDRPFAGLQVDDVVTDLEPAARGPGGMCHVGSVSQGGRELQVWAAADFGQVVVFTPPHRHAFCIEPYTCVTDAVNLEAQGVSAGWRVLEPGKSWKADVGLFLR